MVNSGPIVGVLPELRRDPLRKMDVEDVRSDALRIVSNGLVILEGILMGTIPSKTASRIKAFAEVVKVSPIPALTKISVAPVDSTSLMELSEDELSRVANSADPEGTLRQIQEARMSAKRERLVLGAIGTATVEGDDDDDTEG